MWEDSRNKRGGRWLVSLAKQQRHSELDRLWLETVSGGWEGREGGGRSPREEAGWCGGTIKDSGAVPVTEVEVSPSFLLAPAALSDRGEL